MVPINRMWRHFTTRVAQEGSISSLSMYETFIPIDGDKKWVVQKIIFNKGNITRQGITSSVAFLRLDIELFNIKI